MSRKRRNSKKNTIKVDFTGVEAGGRVPEGDYVVKVKELTAEESQSGNPYLKWVFEVADGRHAGKTLFHNTSLQPQALFNLRATLEALGMDVPQKALNLDLDALIGLSCAVSVETETYQGKERARVVDVFHLDDLIVDDEDEDDEEEYDEEDFDEEEEEDIDEDDDEDEDEDDEDEDDEDEIDVDSMNLKELKAFADEEGIEYPAKVKVKKMREIVQEYLDSQDEEDDEDEDDEEYEEYSEEELEELEDDELIEVAEDYEVDPVYTGKGKKKKLSRKKTIVAILEAIEEDEDEED